MGRYLLPELTVVQSANMTTAGPEQTSFMKLLIEDERRTTNRNIQRTLNGRERLAKLIEEEQLVSEERMSWRLRNAIPTWGESLPDMDSDAVIAAWRRKRGI